MIKSSALSDLLKKVISNGIETVFISKISGEILCIEGKETNQTITDVVSSMWIEYYQFGEGVFKEEKLNYLIIENEDSHILTSSLYGYIICMKSSKNVKLGMLKKHLDALSKNLNKMLEQFKDVLLSKADK